MGEWGWGGRWGEWLYRKWKGVWGCLLWGVMLWGRSLERGWVWGVEGGDEEWVGEEVGVRGLVGEGVGVWKGILGKIWGMGGGIGVGVVWGMRVEGVGEGVWGV